MHIALHFFSHLLHEMEITFISWLAVFVAYTCAPAALGYLHLDPLVTVLMIHTIDLLGNLMCNGSVSCKDSARQGHCPGSPVRSSMLWLCTGYLCTDALCSTIYVYCVHCTVVAVCSCPSCILMYCSHNIPWCAGTAYQLVLNNKCTSGIL